LGRYLLAWFPMILIAAANGALREAWLVPRFGEHAARQVSTLLLVALLAIYIGIVLRIWPIVSGGRAIAVGALWLVLTLVFEFALGRLVSGLSWQQMFAEYDLAAGRLWVLVPIWVSVAPYFFFRLWARRLTPFVCVVRPSRREDPRCRVRWPDRPRGAADTRPGGIPTLSRAFPF
jgi:hypothetical protein